MLAMLWVSRQSQTSTIAATADANAQAFSRSAFHSIIGDDEERKFEAEEQLALEMLPEDLARFAAPSGVDAHDAVAGAYAPPPPAAAAVAPTQDFVAGPELVPGAVPIPASEVMGGDSGRRRLTVAFAVTITQDGPYVDGAAVLAHAVMRGWTAGANGTAIPSAATAAGAEPSELDYELVAIVGRNVSASRLPLAFLGYRIIERPLPVELSEISPGFLRDRVAASGCCGADELLKLWAYTLTEVPGCSRAGGGG